MVRCVGGKKSVYSGTLPFSIEGKYAARVRAITPAGNGSWSNTAAFSLLNKDKSVGEFYNIGLYPRHFYSAPAWICSAIYPFTKCFPMLIGLIELTGTTTLISLR